MTITMQRMQECVTTVCLHYNSVIEKITYKSTGDQCSQLQLATLVPSVLDLVDETISIDQLVIYIHERTNDFCISLTALNHVYKPIFIHFQEKDTTVSNKRIPVLTHES